MFAHWHDVRESQSVQVTKKQARNCDNSPRTAGQRTSFWAPFRRAMDLARGSLDSTLLSKYNARRSAEVAELADAADSKSVVRKDLWVRFPPSAHCLLDAKFVVGRACDLSIGHCRSEPMIGMAVGLVDGFCHQRKN